MTVLASILVALFTGVPRFLIQSFFKAKNKVIKLFGFVFYVGCLLLSIWILLVNAALLGVDESNTWGYAYITSFFTDFFF